MGVRREVWSARVHGDAGRFERATVYLDESGRFVLETSSASAGSADRAVIARGDVDRLCLALDEALEETGG